MIELLAPAGDFEKLRTAIQYGADAVYLGGGVFSLRTAASNFDNEELKRGITYAHSHGKKAYVTANIIPKNSDMDNLYKYAKLVEECGADAIIVSDLGAMSVCLEAAPNLPIHISTQANNINYKTCQMWHKLGAKRVILARELSFSEIKEIRDNCPPDLELEAFVHGAMCISFSGRCLLSNYMASRDANRGDCAQPCRWNYSLVEELRPGEYMPVYENERGTFIFNSKDMCMIGHIPQLVDSGICSFKIEGRVKSEYYVAAVVKAYRQELDRYLENPEKYVFDEKQLDELAKISHRSYSTGFFEGKGGEQVYANSSYIREYDVVAVVKDYNREEKRVYLEQRNKFCVGDDLEFLQPRGDCFTITATNIYDKNNKDIESTPHSKMAFSIPLDVPVCENTFVRKKRL